MGIVEENKVNPSKLTGNESELTGVRKDDLNGKSSIASIDKLLVHISIYGKALNDPVINKNINDYKSFISDNEDKLDIAHRVSAYMLVILMGAMASKDPSDFLPMAKSIYKDKDLVSEMNKRFNNALETVISLLELYITLIDDPEGDYVRGGLIFNYVNHILKIGALPPESTVVLNGDDTPLHIVLQDILNTKPHSKLVDKVHEVFDIPEANETEVHDNKYDSAAIDDTIESFTDKAFSAIDDALNEFERTSTKHKEGEDMSEKTKHKEGENMSEETKCNECDAENKTSTSNSGGDEGSLLWTALKYVAIGGVVGYGVCYAINSHFGDDDTIVFDDIDNFD